jgi:hypothetical protein
MALNRPLALMEQLAQGLLVATHLWVYFPLARLAEYSPTTAEFLRDGVLFGQAGLIAVWIVLGPRTRVLWVAVPYAAAAGIWLLWNYSAGETRPAVIRMLAIDMGMVVAVLGLARRCGLQIARAGTMPPFAPRFQFSLRTLFAFTALVGIVAKPLWELHNSMVAAHRLSLPTAALTTALPAAATAIVTLWVVLSEGRMLVRAAVRLMTILACAGAALLLSGRDADWWLMTLWLAPQVAIIGGSLGVLRGCEYRLAYRIGWRPFRCLAMWWKDQDRIWSATAWRFVESLR